VSDLPKTGSDATLSEQERLILEADTMLKLVNGIALAGYDAATKEYKTLQDFLNKLSGLLINTSVLVSKTYFTHSQTQKQLFTTNLL
jgi:hypothetical protein